MTYYHSNCPQLETDTALGLADSLLQPVIQWYQVQRLKAQVRRERRQLLSLSAAQLFDIGIDRARADQEAHRRDLPANRLETDLK